MIKGLKKIAAIGSLILAGGIYNGMNSEGYSNQGKDYSKKLNKKYEAYQASKLEEISKKETLPKEFYLTPDSLNTCIKQAYKEVGKWPKEIDKRLFRLMIRQESRYNVYAISKSGAMGITQVMPKTYKGYRDSTNLETEIFKPVNNIGVSLEVLNDIFIFCKKNHPNWENLDLEDKRKVGLACYNAGPGRISSKEINWDLNSKKLKEEQREYPNIIMKDYHNPDIKVKL
jgi:hypothetical protein